MTMIGKAGPLIAEVPADQPPRTAPPIPGAVKVGQSIYTVHRKRTLDSDDKLGLTQARKSRILISKDQSTSAARDTLLHEVLHAVCWESGLCHVLGIEDVDEERMIRILTPALLGVIRDNTDLMDYLNSED
jgi:hypothetical protein